MGVRIHASHFPPGTSKWNKIEHRVFCHITQNWRGKPLRTFETIVDMIGNTRTDAGLRVRAELDNRKYPKGVTATDAEMDALSLHRNEFHGDWNYELSIQHVRPATGQSSPIMLRRYPRQRHTAKRIFERLRDEHGFTGGYTIVKDYDREHRRRRREMFVPLTHPPGQAQADFGEAWAVIAGVKQKVHFFAFDRSHPVRTAFAMWRD